MNGADKKRREKVTKKSDNDRAKEYARAVEKRFPNSADGLKYLFLDACYAEEIQEESDHFQESMEELFQDLLGKLMRLVHVDDDQEIVLNT